jgi:CxxC motif-containing protein (DUF1111 family)
MNLKPLAIILSVLFMHSAVSAVAPDIDPNEEFPGGSGSTSDFSVQAFSHPMSGTAGQLRRDFNVGNSFFNKVWVSSTAATTARDGLGPIYNAVACSSCHFKDGRGRGLPENEGPVDVSLLFRLRTKVIGATEVIPHPVYGGQFQPQGVMGVPGEGIAVVKYEKIKLEYRDGIFAELLKPVYDFIKLNFGALGTETITSPRVAPQMIGLGLVEAIAQKDIIQNEDPFDADGDGISGRANRVYSVVHNDVRLGRFGWKAGKPSLLEQNAAAFNGDIGITSSLFPKEDCTDAQPDCLKNQTENDIPMDRLNLVTIYSQLLAVPQRRDFAEPKVLKGRELFHQVNCVSCHTASFTTSAEAPVELLKNQVIYPYSDFLLHDMGEALADNSSVVNNEELATTHEWRTPPLWGAGLIQTVNGHTRYLHDGRARNLEEAILWHGGEAKESKEAFMNLSGTEREELILFLKSL